MTDLVHLFTDNLETALISYRILSTAGGGLLRLLRPGTGQHRRTRR
jgi:hypothetical protein